MNPIRFLQAAILLTALASSSLFATADSVQLANGDVLNGRVLGLDDKQLRLQSETLGEVKIPRGKIVAITLGDHKPAAAAKPAKPGPATSLTPEDVLKQLKVTGVDPKDVGDLKKMLPLLDTPDASKYFNDTLGGLLSGKMSIGDIRKDAIRARDELKKATKGLGPDVEQGIAPYLNILEKFIGETAPAKSDKKPAKK